MHHIYSEQKDKMVAPVVCMKYCGYINDLLESAFNINDVMLQQY